MAARTLVSAVAIWLAVVRFADGQWVVGLFLLLVPIGQAVPWAIVGYAWLTRPELRQRSRGR